MAKNFLARAKSWAAKKRLLGPQGFLKYVIFVYLEELNRVSDEFVFKGGNLLWAYIQIPRATVDLDLSTIEEADDARVKKILGSIGQAEGIKFHLDSFQGTEQGGMRSAVATVSYKTDSGANNKFTVDIMYSTPVELTDMESPVEPGQKIQAASIENIVADKLLAAQRFRGGNTRMKDFDDLWRIAKSGYTVDFATLNRILPERGVDRVLNREWISDQMNATWKSHRAQYKDLPVELEDVFLEVNLWLR
jgi:hypothetical protein